MSLTPRPLSVVPTVREVTLLFPLADKPKVSQATCSTGQGLSSGVDSIPLLLPFHLFTLTIPWPIHTIGP